MHENCIRCKQEIGADALYCPYCGKWQGDAPTKQATKQKSKHKRRVKGSGSITYIKKRSKPYKARLNDKLIGYYATSKEAAAALAAIGDKRLEFYSLTLLDVWHEVEKSKKYQQLGKNQQVTLGGAFKRFKPLHNKKMRELRARDYQEIIDAADDEGMSFSLQQKMRQAVSKACKWALDNDIIGVDYSELLYLPGVDDSVRKIFPDEAIKTLFAHSNERAAGIICFLIGTGMRPVDLTKIKKDERIDLENRTILLEGSKTKAGKNRVITVINECWQIFLRFYMAAPAGGFVFPSLTGTAQLNVKNFRVNEFYPCLERLGIAKNIFKRDGTRKADSGDEKPEYLLYNCRHTFASLSDKAGIKKEVLQKAIGHVVGSSTTDERYIKKTVSDFKDEFEKLDGLLAGVISDKKAT